MARVDSKRYLNWDLVSQIKNLPEDFIKKYSNHLYWPTLCKFQNLSEQLIEQNLHKVDWIGISYNTSNLSKKFLDKYVDKLYWNIIIRRNDLSQEFLREYKDKIDWKHAATNQCAQNDNKEKYSNDFIRQMVHQESKQIEKLWIDQPRKFDKRLLKLIQWEDICRYYRLSDQDIRDNIDNIDWDILSMWQQLSEQIIQEFADKVNWVNISRSQKLSEQFVRKHYKQLNMFDVNYSTFSYSFISKFFNKINKGYLSKNWNWVKKVLNYEEPTKEN